MSTLFTSSVAVCYLTISVPTRFRNGKMLGGNSPQEESGRDELRHGPHAPSLRVSMGLPDAVAPSRARRGRRTVHGRSDPPPVSAQTNRCRQSRACALIVVLFIILLHFASSFNNIIYRYRCLCPDAGRLRYGDAYWHYISAAVSRPRQSRGVFLDSCIIHGQSGSAAWNHTIVNGATPAIAFAAWYADDNPSILTNGKWVENCSMPCNTNALACAPWH